MSNSSLVFSASSKTHPRLHRSTEQTGDERLAESFISTLRSRVQSAAIRNSEWDIDGQEALVIQPDGLGSFCLKHGKDSALD